MTCWGSWARARLGKIRLEFFRFFEKSSQRLTFISEVHKARSRKTGAMVAMKKIIMHNEKDGVGSIIFLFLLFSEHY